ncbi:MAG: BlaI/MecI/CopY family transcriptional regulator [Deltaproteobacteria bacterium]|nr:MAG: BlaI/MecI/CopY family transcriptional regulator [Deltaproteobacteria bacterium]
MKQSSLVQLSRRERQIMEIVYRAGRASATEVLAQLPDPPSYSAVRALLRILENKGHLRHELSGTRYVYLATVGKERARRSALRSMVDTFFEGSASKVVAALLDLSREDLSEQELTGISRLIAQARREGR